MVKCNSSLTARGCGPVRAGHIRRLDWPRILAEALEPRLLLSSDLTLAAAVSSQALDGFQPTFRVIGQPRAQPFASSGPVGFNPTQIRHAYGFDQITFSNGTIVGDGIGQTIAIIDAYDAPTIVQDLHTFNLAFGLPDPPSFKVVSQTGGSTLPSSAPGPGSSWAVETALDVQWAHALAPGANILLVEANSNSLSDLLTAAGGYARTVPEVVAISMSFGTAPSSSNSSNDYLFTTPSGHAGITFLSSTGDTGSPGGYPAYAPTVVAVGGTSLTLDGLGNYVSESGWSGSGGGISAYQSAPSFQAGVTGYTARTIPDVAFDADPYTGVAICDSYDYGASTPWNQIGGTSFSAPAWAALIAIADQRRGISGLASLDGAKDTLPLLYAMPATNFHDITSGSNGGYSAGTGYDLVTGLGTPLAQLVVPAFNTSIGASATPTVPVLQASSDTGVSSFYNITSLNNSSAATELQFSVGGTVSGATIRLLSDGNLIGQAVATGTTTPITTNGTFTLPDGIHSISATQTVLGLTTSTASVALAVSVRTLPPAVVSQSLSGSVAGAQTDLIFTFNEAVDPSTFSLAAGVSSFTGPSGDLRSALSGFTWSAGNTVLEVQFSIQSAPGVYQMVLAPGLHDLAGNVMSVSYAAPFTIIAAIYLAGMESNPGWTFDSGSLWQWGAAKSGGSHNGDPAYNSEGVLGGNIIGYNIGGDFVTNNPVYYATTPTIDCSNDTTVYLNSQRWLGVGTGSGATIQLSVDNGSTWSTIWSSNATYYAESSWSLQTIRLTAADGKSQVELRWGMGPVPSRNANPHPGWSIDDVLVYGTPLSSISGQVFLDSNGNGALDNGQSGLNGVTVFIDSNNNGVWNTGEPTTVTSGSGNYSLIHLAAGSYTVREVVPTGYIATQPPANNLALTLATSTNATGNNFGNFPSTFTASSSSTNFTLDRTMGGSQVQVISQSLAGGPPTVYTINPSLLNTLTFIGGAGDDTLTLDFTNGNPLPSGGITFNGGGPSNGDTILIHGTPGVTTLSVTGTQITLGTAVVNYTNVRNVIFDSDLWTGSIGMLPALTVSTGGVVFTANVHLDSLTLYPGGAVRLANAGGQLLTLNTINFYGGTLDLAKNSLLVHQTTLTGIESALAAAYQNGAWSGVGLNSSYAQSHPGRGLGYLRGDVYNALNNNALFAGAVAGAGDILVQCAWQGDVNLNGSVTAIAFTQMDVSFLRGLTNATWFNGDWNYDGVVTTSDFALINAAYGLQNAGPLAVAATVPPTASKPATVAPVAASVTVPTTAAPFAPATLPHLRWLPGAAQAAPSLMQDQDSDNAALTNWDQSQARRRKNQGQRG